MISLAFSGVASLAMIFGAVWHFTPHDASWKNSIISAVVHNTSKEVLNYQGYIERDHYKTWAWTSSAEKHDPIVTIHFKRNSGKKMKIMVFKEDQLDQYKTDQSAVSYELPISTQCRRI